jgi:hypothetical protein
MIDRVKPERIRWLWWAILAWCALIAAWNVYWLVRGSFGYWPFALSMVVVVAGAGVAVWGLWSTSRRPWWRW